MKKMTFPKQAQLDRVIEESQPAPIMHAQSSIHLSELDDTQFQRSMSLPRGFGGQRQPQQQNHPAVHQAGPVPPPPRSDSMTALRNIMARRHRVRVSLARSRQFFAPRASAGIFPING